MRVVEYRPRCRCLRKLMIPPLGRFHRPLYFIPYDWLPRAYRCVFHKREYRRGIRPTVTHATRRWPFRWPWRSA